MFVFPAEILEQVFFFLRTKLFRVKISSPELKISSPELKRVTVMSGFENNGTVKCVPGGRRVYWEVLICILTKGRCLWAVLQRSSHCLV